MFPGKEVCHKNIIPRDGRTLMRTRTKLLKKLSKKPTSNTDSGRESVESKVKEIETKLKESYEKEREHEENKALMAIKTNPKYFHSYAQKKLKSRAKIGPLEDQNGELVENPEKMANMLEEQYKSVYSEPMAEKEVLNSN